MLEIAVLVSLSFVYFPCFNQNVSDFCSCTRIWCWYSANYCTCFRTFLIFWWKWCLSWIKPKERYRIYEPVFLLFVSLLSSLHVFHFRSFLILEPLYVFFYFIFGSYRHVLYCFSVSTFLKCPEISTQVPSLIKHFMWSSLLEIVSGLGISSSINAGKA